MSNIDNNPRSGPPEKPDLVANVTAEIELARAIKTRLSRDASALEGQGLEGFSAPDVKNPRGGRKPKPDSQERVAEEIGIGTMTLNEAQRHVQAVERATALNTRLLGNASGLEAQGEEQLSTTVVDNSQRGPRQDDRLHLYNRQVHAGGLG